MSTNSTSSETESTFLIALQVIMYTTFVCGLIALMVVFMLTP